MNNGSWCQSMIVHDVWLMPRQHSELILPSIQNGCPTFRFGNTFPIRSSPQESWGSSILSRTTRPWLASRFRAWSALVFRPVRRLIQPRGTSDFFRAYYFAKPASIVQSCAGRVALAWNCYLHSWGCCWASFHCLARLTRCSLCNEFDLFLRYLYSISSLRHILR